MLGYVMLFQVRTGYFVLVGDMSGYARLSHVV